METNTVYTEKGWISQGCAIYSKGDKEPLWTRVARVSTEVPESEMIGVIELLRAAPETARKLAEADARIEELEKMRSNAIARAKSVMADDFFCHSDWKGLLEILE